MAEEDGALGRRGSSPTEPSGQLAREVEEHINHCEWCQARYLLKSGVSVDEFLHALRTEVEQALAAGPPPGRDDTGESRPESAEEGTDRDE